MQLCVPGQHIKFTEDKFQYRPVFLKSVFAEKQILTCGSIIRPPQTSPSHTETEIQTNH